jgi:hypothetical protein
MHHSSLLIPIHGTPFVKTAHSALSRKKKFLYPKKKKEKEVLN